MHFISICIGLNIPYKVCKLGFQPESVLGKSKVDMLVQS